MSLAKEYANLSEDEATDLIVKALEKIVEIQDAKKADEKLKAMKETVKDLNKAYSDAAKEQRKKIDALMKQRQSVIDAFEAKHASR